MTATFTGSQASSSRTRSALGLVGWLVLSFAAAAAGGFFRPDEWYANLLKPSWNPPNWVFAPVWTTLYAVMGIAAWLVWQRGGFEHQRVPLTLFLVQLFLNAIWSPLFFGLHNPALALLDIAALWMALVLTIKSFWKSQPIAAVLLMPYLAWITFAAALNFAIWKLNA